MSWENKPKTAGVFIGFELGVFFFEPWMITLGLTVPFLLNIVILSITGGWNKMTVLRRKGIVKAFLLG